MTSQAVSCAIGLLFVTSLLCLVSTYPQGYSKLVTDEYVNECHETLHPATATLCQRCAKHSRASNVYPLCCEDREEVRTWCEKYLAYGQRQ
ncbi:uncharacterized protein [Halyomorpha halys]|uniref:uncharacterized protein n=1 Tax=Halyomorpha halys TaxID=286706 RepID=UPI0006D4C7B4|nr:uncharacterized protein LOC106690686 [Halyomorpha halys]